MNPLIFHKLLIKRTINMMRLIGIHSPSILKLIILILQLCKGILLHHKLPRHLIPPLLPVNPGIKDQYRHIVNTSVHSDQSKPAAFHWSELVVVNDKTVVVQFVLVKRALEVKFDGVLRAELGDWDHAFVCFLYLYGAGYVALEWRDEETVGTLVDFCDLDVLWSGEILPLLSVFDEHFIGNIAYRFWVWLLFRATEVFFSVLVVNVFESLLGVVFQTKFRVFALDYALIIGEYHGWGSE